MLFATQRMQAYALLTVCASGFLHSADVDPDRALELEMERMTEEQQDQIQLQTEEQSGQFVQRIDGPDYIFGMSDEVFSSYLDRLPKGIVGEPLPPFTSTKTEAKWLGGFKVNGDGDLENEAEGSIIEGPPAELREAVSAKERKLNELRVTKRNRAKRHRQADKRAQARRQVPVVNLQPQFLSPEQVANSGGSSFNIPFVKPSLLELNTSVREEATTKSCASIKSSTNLDMPMFLYYSDWHKEMLTNKPVPRDEEQQSREALARHMFGRGIESNMRRLSTTSKNFMACANYDGRVVISTHAGNLDHAPARTMMVGEVKKKGKKSQKTGKRLYKTVTGGHLRPQQMWEQIMQHIFSNDIKPQHIFFLACNSGNHQKYGWFKKDGERIKVKTEGEREQHYKKWKFDTEVESYAHKMALQTAKHNHGRSENFGEPTVVEGEIEGTADMEGRRVRRYLGYHREAWHSHQSYGDAFVTGYVAPKGFFVRGMGQAFLAVMNNYHGNEADPGTKREEALWHSSNHVPDWSTKDGQSGLKLLLNIEAGHYSPHLAEEEGAELAPNHGFGRWNVPVQNVDQPDVEDQDLTPEELQELIEDAADAALEHDEDEEAD